MVIASKELFKHSNAIGQQSGHYSGWILGLFIRYRTFMPYVKCETDLFSWEQRTFM